MNTVTDGRLDIVIFENGGKEFLAKLPSSPEIDEQLYLPLVTQFVAQNQDLKEPTKFTGTYRMKDDELEITWGPYAGEIPHYGEIEVEESPEIDAMMAERGIMPPRP